MLSMYHFLYVDHVERLKIETKSKNLRVEDEKFLSYIACCDLRLARTMGKLAGGIGLSEAEPRHDLT